MKIQQIIDTGIVDQLYEEGHRYSHYGSYQRKVHGMKICKVPLNANFTCPNWDGRLAESGCDFCPNFARQFTYDSFRTVMNKGFKKQIAHQVEHYQTMGAGDKALVYIAFGTNTYAPLDKLRRIYDESLAHEDVIGLSIGTRPDCLPPEVLDLMGEYVESGYEMWVEVGQQTPHFHTLEGINRRHGFAEAVNVVAEAHDRGIRTIFFNIFGMPGETPSEMIETARIYSALGVDAVKLYPLIVMKDTKLAEDYKAGRYKSLGFTEYVNLVVDFIEHLSPYVLVQRLSKDCGLETKLAPSWNTYRLIVGPAVEKEMEERGTKQGSKFKLGLSVDELTPLR
ncbi:MAG: TIGR01212 family radical SAM protein [Candidatus Altiarchaeota archaeon]